MPRVHKPQSQVELQSVKQRSCPVLILEAKSARMWTLSHIHAKHRICFQAMTPPPFDGSVEEKGKTALEATKIKQWGSKGTTPLHPTPLWIPLWAVWQHTQCYAIEPGRHSQSLLLQSLDAQRSYWWPGPVPSMATQRDWQDTESPGK